MTTDAAAAIRDQALEVAAGWSPPDAPPSWRLTAALLRAIAGHEPLLGRLAALPPGRLPALLASAAITFLVRRDRPAPLASYFPVPGPEAVAARLRRRLRARGPGVLLGPAGRHRGRVRGRGGTR